MAACLWRQSARTGQLSAIAEKKAPDGSNTQTKTGRRPRRPGRPGGKSATCDSRTRCKSRLSFLPLSEKKASMNAFGNSGSDSAASGLLRAVLPSSTSSDAQVAQYSRERLQDRRIQITNLDRARPRTGADDADVAARAELKLSRRKRRVKSELSQLKRLLIAANRHDAASTHQSSDVDETVKGKQRHISSLKRELKRISHSKKRANTAKRTAKVSHKQLSRSQRKRLGLEDVDDYVTFDLIKPLHDLWCSYIQQLLNMVVLNGQGELVPNPYFDASSLSVMSSGNVAAVQASLIKADLCGAELEVVRSSNPSLVTQHGLVIKETERTIILAIAHPPGMDHAAPKSKNVHIIPKHNTVFRIFVPVPSSSTEKVQQLRFELHGNHMMHALPARATRKYKARPSIDF